MNIIVKCSTAILVFSLFLSCRKQAELSPGNSTASSQVNNESLLANKPCINGALVVSLSQNLSTGWCMGVLQKLNTKYTRHTMAMENWTGRNAEYESYTNNGYRVLENICYKVQNDSVPAPFPTDTVAYKKTLSSILNTYSPEVSVIENEEGNFDWHEGSMQDYINELRAAMTVIHAHKLKGCNGGLSTRPLTFLVYRWYVSLGQTGKAESFATRCIPDKYMYNLRHPGNSADFEFKIRSWDSLVQAYRTVPIDYVNIHIYEPIKYRCEPNATELSKNIAKATDSALLEICTYLTGETGKKIMSNEMGQLNKQKGLTSSMLQVNNDCGLKYNTWFSGDWGLDKSFALHTDAGTLRRTGIAFRDYIINNPQ
jgi:hypothetical protein